MASLECSLTGTALGWYTRLNDPYKRDWSAFLQAFKKQLTSQKHAHYAQVEVIILVKKDNETVHQFALKIQQLINAGALKMLLPSIEDLPEFSQKMFQKVLKISQTKDK